MSDYLKFKKSNCKNCYKCIRKCPVKSIRFSAEQANIVGQSCILCGQCFVVCPQNAKEIVGDEEKVKVLLMSGEKVIASIAPSFTANYDGIGIESIEKALKKLGFAFAEETAIGATIVKNAYERLLKEGNRDIIISSCCHSVNLLIQKHFPFAVDMLADLISPMQAHCKDIKKRYEGAKTVFIGPCVAKKDEAERYKGSVDAVLTYEEITKWIEEENISIEKEQDQRENSKARLFPIAGGIIKSMNLTDINSKYTYIAIDGVENCIAALKDIEKGNIHNCFIEMSACTGSCIGGPVMEKYHRSPVRDYTCISDYAGEKDFCVDSLQDSIMKKQFDVIDLNEINPDDTEISVILKQMGKTKPEHELNCGTCGYNTCREKALAVYRGKADLSMCLPFLKERAESFSSNLINNTYNGIFVLNDKLEVQQINKVAMNIMNIRSSSDVLGEPVVHILDPKDFIEVARTGKSIKDKRVYIADYNKYVEESIVYDKDYNMLICIMRDITLDEIQKENKKLITKNTIEIADKVVEKQMRVVQEIASLLGETVAETKIALTKLKETIKNE